jgi:urease accessory protein
MGMTEIASIYLGNILEDNIVDRLNEARQEHLCWEVHLAERDRNKGRILAVSTSGLEIGIIKNRDWQIREGDVFITETARLVLVHLQARELMVLSFSEPVGDFAIPLVHLGHILGNQHYPISIELDKIYVELIGDRELMEQTINNLAIPGLKIAYELKSSDEVTFRSHRH